MGRKRRNLCAQRDRARRLAAEAALSETISASAESIVNEATNDKVIETVAKSVPSSETTVKTKTPKAKTTSTKRASTKKATTRKATSKPTLSKSKRTTSKKKTTTSED